MTIAEELVKNIDEIEFHEYFFMDLDPQPSDLQEFVDIIDDDHELSIVICSAAQYGTAEHIKWFHENTSQHFHQDIMDEAVFTQNYDVMVWLNKNRNDGCTPEAMRVACQDGADLEVLELIYDNYPKSFNVDDCMLYAYHNRNYEALGYLLYKCKPNLLDDRDLD